MHPIDKALSFPHFKMFLIKVGLCLLGASYFLIEKKEVIAVVGGYVLLSVNIYVLAYLAKLVFTIVAQPAEGETKHNPALLGMAVVFKFCFLAGSLYGMIIVFHLSEVAIFVGSIVALISISGYLSVKYLEHLASLKLEGLGRKR